MKSTFVLTSVLFPILLGVWMKYKYGGGQTFESDYRVSDRPLIPNEQIEKISLDMPPGCVTISPIDGRVFFDTHPLSNPPKDPTTPFVFELLHNGTVVPWPPRHQELLIAPFGIHADQQGRVWMIEPALVDRWNTRVVAFDAHTGDMIYDYQLPHNLGRMAQDIRVSLNGKYLILADTGMFGILSAHLLVLDIAKQEIVRTLYHSQFNPQNWITQMTHNNNEPKRVLWGLMTFKAGLDGIAFSPDGQYLYLGPMTHNTMFRIPTAQLLDFNLSDSDVSNSVEPVAAKPQSDGIAFTPSGNLLITDVENGGLAVLRNDKDDGKEVVVETLTRDDVNVGWADSVEAYGNTVVFTDSKVVYYIQQDLQPPSVETVKKEGPFHIYRFQIPEGL